MEQKHIELLKMLNKDNESTIKPEIEAIQKEIKNFKERLSLDTLLTELDGMIEMRGRVIVATTNFINKIDGALLREGRFDLKIELHKFVDSEIKEMLCKMYHPLYTDIITKETFPDNVWSPAKIRNICHMFKEHEIEKVINVLKNP